MTEPMNDFEQRLADGLRSWTEDAPRRADFAVEARHLAESQPSPGRRWLATLLAVSTATAAVAVTLAVLSLAPLNPHPAASGSPSASSANTPVANGSPAATAANTPAVASEPPASASAGDVDLAEFAWYDLVSVAFGTPTAQDPDASPDPNALQPEPYTQLRVGTLEGPVTAELRLTEEAFATGPFGMDVLVGQDDGSSSSLMLVSSADGSTRDLYSTSDLIVMGTLRGDGDVVYYVPVDRANGADRGLWSFTLDSGEATQVVEGPLAEAAHDFATSWQMQWSAGGETLVTQSCRQSRCRELAYRLRDGRVSESNASELIGVTDTEYLVFSSRSSPTVLAIDLESGESRTVGSAGGPAVLASAGDDWYIAYEPSQADPRAYALAVLSVADGRQRTLIEQPASQPTGAWVLPSHDRADLGAAVPDGFVLRWPPEGQAYPDTGIPPHEWSAGELVHVVTDIRIRVPPRIDIRDYPDCAPVPPSELPSGNAVGEAIETYAAHRRWATWGSNTDQVVQVVGDWLFASDPTSAAATAVTVRGRPGRVQAMASIDGPFAIAWEESGCRYEVQLAPGVIQEEAIEYAGRY